MQTIKLTHPHQLKQSDIPDTVMALGYFDGIHKGHRQVIETAKQIAKKQGMICAVMTFFPHPSVVLGKLHGPIQYITPMGKKIAVMAELGIDRLYVVNFNQDFAKLAPADFVAAYVTGLRVKHVVAGFDFTFGRFGKGTMSNIKEYAQDSFTYTVVDKVTYNGEKISSTLIRACILEGQVETLPQYLGRFYSFDGTVIHGDERGRQIGFPTANIKVDTEYLLPSVGVYAVRIKVDSTWFNGVCNVGYRPTFHQNTGHLSIEVHIFDFSDMIYDQRVTIEWHKRIRGEEKFGSIEQLVEQISLDKDDSLTYFQSLILQ